MLIAVHVTAQLIELCITQTHDELPVSLSTRLTWQASEVQAALTEK
jgi:hypothetical protein